MGGSCLIIWSQGRSGVCCDRGRLHDLLKLVFVDAFASHIKNKVKCIPVGVLLFVCLFAFIVNSSFVKLSSRSFYYPRKGL